MKLKKLSLILIFAASASLCAGCASFFDTNTATGGKKVSFQEDMKAKKAKQKPKAKAVHKTKQIEDTESSKLGNDIEKTLSTELKAGVVKPYVPDDRSNNQSLLPHVSSLEGREASNELNKVSMKDVLEGKVDLNKLYEQEHSQDDKSTQVQEQKLTPFVDGGSNEEDIASAVNQSVEGLSQESSKTCHLVDSSVAQNKAYTIATAQAKRISPDLGTIYVAPTIVPEELHECITDLSKPISTALNENSHKAISSGKLRISQNQGSSTLIPSLVRACRQNNVPLLNVSIIRKTGSKYMLNIRNIRVHDGITIVQTSQALN